MPASAGQLSSRPLGGHLIFYFGQARVFLCIYLVGLPYRRRPQAGQTQSLSARRGANMDTIRRDGLGVVDDPDDGHHGTYRPSHPASLPTDMASGARSPIPSELQGKFAPALWQIRAVSLLSILPDAVYVYDEMARERSR